MKTIIAILLFSFPTTARAASTTDGELLRLKEAAPIVLDAGEMKKARAIEPGPSGGPEHPAAAVAKDYLEAHRAAFGLSGPAPAVIGIRFSVDPDVGDTTFRVRFERQYAGNVPVEFTEIELLLSEKKGVWRFVNAGGKWVRGLVPQIPALSDAEARKAVVGALRPGATLAGPGVAVLDREVNRDPELVFVPREGLSGPASDYALAWKFYALSPPVLAWYVDAFSGKTVRILEHH